MGRPPRRAASVLGSRRVVVLARCCERLPGQLLVGKIGRILQRVELLEEFVGRLFPVDEDLLDGLA
jgi:hypothetical protein